MFYELSNPELLNDEQTDELYRKKTGKDDRVKWTRAMWTAVILTLGTTFIFLDRMKAAQAKHSSNPACMRY